MWGGKKVGSGQKRGEAAATDKELFLFIHPEAIRIPTVSFSETEINTTALLEFDRLLRKGKPGDEQRFVFHASSRGCVV